MDIDHKKISGLVPNSQAGEYGFRLRCVDSLDQIVSQDFNWTFVANQNPGLTGIDMSALTFTIGEGMDSEHIIPSGIYIDPDGDSIYYDYAFFNDFTTLDSWINMVSGYEGSAKLVFTDTPQTDKTGFQIFLSDGIDAATTFFLLNFTVNKRPQVVTSLIVLPIYPNLDLSVDLNIDMEVYFSDPEDDDLYYSFWDVPPQLNVIHTGGSEYQITGEFEEGVTDLEFTFKANDGISKPVNVTVRVDVQDCDPLCDRCYGGSVSECYSCTGTNVLDLTSCLDECPTGKYDESGVCEECNSACHDCDGVTNHDCFTCSADYYMKYGTCVQHCGDYYIGQNNECHQCIDNCQTCTGTDGSECTECQDGYVFMNDQCIRLDCPQGQFVDSTVCSDCHDACSACTGGTNADCEQCSGGYTMNSFDE